MRNLLLACCLVFTTVNFGQEKKLTCKDFKKGTFYSPVETESPEKYIIIRNDSIQTEEILNKSDITDSRRHKTIHGKLKWINDCDYIISYDKTKMIFGETEKFINKHGGVKTEMIKIKDKCYYYKSSLSVDGKTQVMKGKICKGVPK